MTIDAACPSPTQPAMPTPARWWRAGTVRLCGPLVLAICAALLPAQAEAQAQPQRNSTAGDITVLLLRPLSFFNSGDMSFGDILPGRTAGTVRLRPDGTRTATGGVTLVGNSHQPGTFAGLGRNGQQVLISMPSTVTYLNGPGTRMRLYNFELGSTPTAILTTSPQRFRISSPLGNFNFPVGATLDVGANQAPGVYEGTYAITLVYQ